MPHAHGDEDETWNMGCHWAHIVNGWREGQVAGAAVMQVVPDAAVVMAISSVSYLSSDQSL
jgi:hypothetical protein